MTNRAPNMKEATIVCLKKWNRLNGRARRAEFWWFYLVVYLLMIAFSILFNVLIVFLEIFGETQSLIALIGFFLVCIALSIPSLCAVVRRLHDIGKSGWTYLIGLVPIVGPIILLMWLAKDSDPETNMYGPSPKYDPDYVEDYSTDGSRILESVDSLGDKVISGLGSSNSKSDN